MSFSDKVLYHWFSLMITDIAQYIFTTASFQIIRQAAALLTQETKLSFKNKTTMYLLKRIVKCNWSQLKIFLLTTRLRHSAPTHLSALATALGLWLTSTTPRVKPVQTWSCPKNMTRERKEIVPMPWLKKGLRYKFNPRQVPVSIHRWVLTLPQEPSMQGRLAANQKTTWAGPGFIHPSARGTRYTFHL